MVWGCRKKRQAEVLARTEALMKQWGYPMQETAVLAKF